MKLRVKRMAVILLGLYAGTSLGQQYFYNDKYYDSDWLIEAGVFAGGMNALTDLGGRKGKGAMFLKDLNLRNTKSCFGFHLGVFYKYSIGFQLNFTHGTVSAQDSILKNETGSTQLRYIRNLHFKSPINEFSGLFEWHFLSQTDQARLLSPFLLLGVGYYSFRPQAKIYDKWVNLQPLHTEGQGFVEYPDRPVYALNQFNFPMGLGLQLEISAIFNMRLEVLNRLLLTDYLDDVSRNYIDPSLFSKYLSPSKAGMATVLADRRNELVPNILSIPGEMRGNSSRNDSYFSIHVKTSLIINRKRR